MEEASTWTAFAKACQKLDWLGEGTCRVDLRDRILQLSMLEGAIHATVRDSKLLQFYCVHIFGFGKLLSCKKSSGRGNKWLLPTQHQAVAHTCERFGAGGDTQLRTIDSKPEMMRGTRVSAFVLPVYSKSCGAA